MEVDYLRVSVTDRCNLNCIYCRPYKKFRIKKEHEFINLEEIVDFIRLAADWGIRKIRITGGEPLLREDIVKLVGAVAEISKIKDTAITTNGVKLGKLSSELKEAGLCRVNVSLDSLNAKKFSRITGCNSLSLVLEGIKCAGEVGLEPVKINVVMLKGINDEEVNDFIEFSQENSLILRFIEYMPVKGVKGKNWYISNKIVKKKIEKRWGELRSVSFDGNGPAEYFTIKGGSVPVGFISFTSHPFCQRCNRLRLTCEGKLKPCLNSNFELETKKGLRGKDKKEQVKKLFNLAVKFKKEGEVSESHPDKKSRFMFQIGG